MAFVKIIQIPKREGVFLTLYDVTANLKCPAVDGVKCPKIDERAGQVTPS